MKKSTLYKNMPILTHAKVTKQINKIQYSNTLTINYYFSISIFRFFLLTHPTKFIYFCILVFALDQKAGIIVNIILNNYFMIKKA
jgi:hypothetical protein